MPHIITVDDFGYSGRTNALVKTAIEGGVLTHVAMMMNRPGTDEALRYAAKFRESATRYGLHFNVTEGAPLSAHQDIRSIVDQQGQFLGWPGLMQKLMLGRVDTAHIERELGAQCEVMIRAGVSIAFLNSHHHIHLWPCLARMIAPMLPRYHIQRVRAPRAIWWPALGLRHGPKAVAIQAAGPALQGRYRPLARYVIDLDWAARTDVARARLYRRIPPAAEIMCHPHDETARDNAHSVNHSTLAWLLDRESVLPH